MFAHGADLSGGNNASAEPLLDGEAFGTRASHALLALLVGTGGSVTAGNTIGSDRICLASEARSKGRSKESEDEDDDEYENEMASALDSRLLRINAFPPSLFV
jgi:hypothetical protein